MLYIVVSGNGSQMLSGLYCEGLTDCYSFPSGEPVPDYKPPFETELGEITNEAMQEFVARQKRRPGFPDVWKHNHPVSAFYCFLKVNRNVTVAVVLVKSCTYFWCQ